VEGVSERPGCGPKSESDFAALPEGAPTSGAHGFMNARGTSETCRDEVRGSACGGNPDLERVFQKLAGTLSAGSVQLSLPRSLLFRLARPHS
jgi:hypothetical protein